jgi:hypothetical protein
LESLPAKFGEATQNAAALDHSNLGLLAVRSQLGCVDRQRSAQRSQTGRRIEVTTADSFDA